MVSFIIIFFICGLFITVSQRTHLISVFIGIEFLALSTILLSGFAIPSVSCFVLLIMCIAVCEASVALALIVSIVRVSGSDQSVNLIADNS